MTGDPAAGVSKPPEYQPRCSPSLTAISPPASPTPSGAAPVAGNALADRRGAGGINAAVASELAVVRWYGPAQHGC